MKKVECQRRSRNSYSQDDYEKLSKSKQELQKSTEINIKKLCSLNQNPGLITPLMPGDPDMLATIVCAYLRKMKAVLVFCPTRQGCQQTALFLSKLLPL
jgi:hypothetical protein